MQIGINVKNDSKFKKLNIKILKRGKKKEKLHRTAKAQCRSRGL